MFFGSQGIPMATATDTSIVGLAPQATWPLACTLADLQAHLGGIPADRILANPLPGLASEDDAASSKSRFGRLCELVDGVLVEKPLGYYESSIAGILFAIIREFVNKHKLGLVSCESAPLKLKPGTVRMPDVSFISFDRFPNRKPPRVQIMPVAPTLAVEVLSPSNTPSEMNRKLHEYFAADVKLVWYIDPVARSAKAFKSLEECEVVDQDGELNGDPVLPGLRIQLGKVFAEAFSEPSVDDE
jgi:Uma2 family endonuclease